MTVGEGMGRVLETHNISAQTSRGYVYGWEYYGTFNRALFTLFQVIAGESTSDLARPPSTSSSPHLTSPPLEHR